MIAPSPDLATTPFLLPPDVHCLSVSELSPRLRAKIGVIEDDHSVITRPGFRVTTRLVPRPLAELISEFRAPSLLTDAVLRFARAHGEDPLGLLDLTFDALVTLVDARILVPEGSPDALAPSASLSAGQAFAGFEIAELVRSLDDSEVYLARGANGLVALKIARDDRASLQLMFENEARTLARLGGADTPRLFDSGRDRGRPFVAMEWCEGVSIAIAAQQLRAARDRRRLHRLVGRMLDAYARLHDAGVLHGDIHPGNCLVRRDGRVVILDFGHARRIGNDNAIDPARSGIPQFYDPQIAAELRAGRLPPGATPASEQYAIAVLAYVLLTGLPPIHSSAVRDELLERIAEGSAPLPFAARGVAAWPNVERVLSRALSREPAARFADMAGFARAFSSARLPRNAHRRPAAAQRAFHDAVAGVRHLAASAEPVHHAWFALRAALALEDAELLACADLLAHRAGSDCAASTVAALTARAQCDRRGESRAIERFVAATGNVDDGPDTDAALLGSAAILDGIALRRPAVAALLEWVMRSRSAVAEPLRTYVELSLVKSNAIAIDADLRTRTTAMAESHLGDVWLWALAYDVFAVAEFRALALAAPLPRQPVMRAFAFLRLHQLTGEARWVTRARRLLANGEAIADDFDRAWISAELLAPERAVLPFYLLPSLAKSGPRRVAALPDTAAAGR